MLLRIRQTFSQPEEASECLRTRYDKTRRFFLAKHQADAGYHLGYDLSESTNLKYETQHNQHSITYPS